MFKYAWNQTYQLILYCLTGDSSTFNIHENTGIITVRGTPDKTLPYKVLTVSVSDGGSPELTSTTQVIIHTQKYSFEQVRAAIGELAA